MLDNPEKTARLLAALKAAVPFEIELAERVIKNFRTANPPVAFAARYTVSDLSYAGDEGGIICHTARSIDGGALAISLAQVRVPRSAPFAAAVAGYRKHRVKKLKSQGRA